MGRNLRFLQLLAVVAFIGCLVGPAAGRTWHVAKDGSGDFAVIQDAVDAASAGDTIWIHAGRYVEMTLDHDLWDNGTVYVNVHVAVTKDNLTFQGDGRDVTIIGPEVFPGDQPQNYLAFAVTAVYANSVVVRDLAIENVNYGLYSALAIVEVTGCRFENAVYNGIRVYSSTSCLVDDCDFIGGGVGLGSYDPTRNLTISNSRFDGTSTVCLCVSTDNVVIENCTAVNARTGIGIQQGSTGILRNVDVSVSVGTGLALEMGGAAEVYDSRFEGGLSGVYGNGESVRCERTTFVGQTTWTARINNSGNSVFNECEFLDCGEYAVMCVYNGSGDCHIDMTNNYWGTDSEAQIAELIHDSNDEPGRCCTVDFIPFHSESTPTEPHSWSEVKGLFDSSDGGDR